MSKYLRGTGINYRGTLSKIKKKDDPLQPIFEAFTNSFESIELLEDDIQNHEITINLFVNKDMASNANQEYFDFFKIEVRDTGIGFNNAEFQRVEDLNDTGKGFNNQGSGRVQFIHAFDTAEVFSVYKNEQSSTKFSQRIFTLSKSELFLNHNAIIRLEDNNELESQEDHSSTVITFKGVLATKDTFFNTVTARDLKISIIKHYLVKFCKHRNNLPKITIKRFIDDVIDSEFNIKSDDIPNIDKEEDIEVAYSNLNDKNEIVDILKTEVFNIKAFKIDKDDLGKNEIRLTSKGEEAKNIKLESLTESDQIDGNRYLFLISSDYINNNDGDTRGEIQILTRAEFIEKNDMFIDDKILLESIEYKVNRTILTMYDEIEVKNKEKRKNIGALKKMFLLSQETLDALGNSISINDSDTKILEKVYKADAKTIAKTDADIKRQISELDLDTTKGNYSDELKEKADELVKLIPLQNRTAITHYVARRKLVLELFDKIIKQQLQVQKTGRGIDEKLLHNLIFQQSSGNPGESDLWLMNEDFIYFKGASENQLGAILLDGQTVIKDDFSEEEEAYRLKQEGDANKKRPDILLFPKEEKCIIIEFKSLNTNVSNHLNQINRYASLINNLSKDKYNFTTYYGYLIGENIDVDDIQDNDSDFISAHQLDFIFRPYKRITGKFGKSDGSLYTEVIKYSTLLERALIRNQIFIDKITMPIE